MSKKSEKEYCSVLKYLKLNHKNDLYQSINELCLKRDFHRASNSNAGMTFLLPNKEYIKLIKQVSNDTPITAVNMIKSLILTRYVSNINDFENPVGNMNKHKLHTKTQLKESGVEIKVLSGKGYKDLNGKNTKIYEIKIPFSKDKVPELGSGEYVQPGNLTTTGGMGHEQSTKYKIAKCVEASYIKSNNSDGNNSAYIVAVALICKYSDSGDYEKIYKGLCASYKATFYYLLNPYGKKNDFVDESKHASILEGVKAMEVTAVGSDNTNKCKKIVDDIINQYRNKHPENHATEIESRNKKYTNSIQNINTVTDIVGILNNLYDNHPNKSLYKDLLTIYCYITTTIDDHDGDYNSNNFFETVFVVNLSTCINDGKGLCASLNDLAHNYSMYANLLKSDALLYIPMLSTEGGDASVNHYTQINGLPEPSKNIQFTIQFNDTMVKRGGGDKTLAQILDV
jgi:hypothetical protein